MGKFKDLSGMKFDKLTVISRIENPYSGSTSAIWLCKCDCGNYTKRDSHSLTYKEKNSCGCDQSYRHKTHGMTDTRIYNIWRGMKNRCYCKSNIKYKNYGGRGIKVCDSWLCDFQSFYSWSISNGYSDNLTIDRIDTNGDYTPDNCRWITAKAQNYNKRNNRKYEHNGINKTVTEWAAELGGKYGDSISSRIDSGWDVSKALTTPIAKREKEIVIEIEGESKTVTQWSKVYGTHRTTINSRIKAGWNPIEAVTTPVRRKRGD